MAVLEKSGLSATYSLRGIDTRPQHSKRAAAELIISVAAAGAASTTVEIVDEGRTVLIRCAHAAGGPRASARVEKCLRCGGIAAPEGPLELQDDHGFLSSHEMGDVASHDPECPVAHVRDVLQG